MTTGIRSLRIRSLRTLAALAASAALAACGSATGGAAGEGGTPSPEGGRDAETATGRGPAILYRAPSSSSYALARADTIVMQLPGGQSQTQVFDRTMYLSVSLRGGAAGDDADLPVTVVLDSLRAAEGSLVPADSLRQAEGTRWTGTLSPTGELSALEASKTSGIGDQIGGTLQLLFPVLPDGGARAGGAWSDTLTNRTKANAFDVEERSVVRYRAAQRQDGARGLRITAEAQVTQSGSGQQAGQVMEMQSTGTRRIDYLLAADGRLTRAEGTDSTDMVITVPAVGQSVPVRTVGRFTVTPLGAPR